MNEISNIHAFEDDDFLHACFVWGMAVLGAFAVCLVPVFMLLGGPADLDAADAGGWTAVLGWIVGLAAVSAASFAVHELVHAFSGYPLLCYLAAGLHLSGCVGDWYYVRTILRDRRIVACEDTSFGVRFFAR